MIPFLSRRPGMALALAVLVAAPAAALAWTKDVRVSGMGVRKCSEWTAWKNSQNGEARAMTVEWAQGFLSGHNVYTSPSGSVNSVVADAKTLATLLDNFCQRNPEERILAGMLDIAQSLGGAKINFAPKTPPAGPAPAKPAVPEGKAGRES